MPRLTPSARRKLADTYPADSYERRILALTPLQRTTLELCAIHMDERASTKGKAQLEELGLLEAYDHNPPEWPAMTVKRYSVPIHVHIAWAEVCHAEGDARYAAGRRAL